MREKIGFWEAFSIGVGGMIGGGIFAVLGLSVELSKSAAPVAFLLAGLIALTTAYSYARLSVRYPSEGGTIEFIVRAFGGGLLSGSLNILLLASYVVMISLYAYAFGSYAANIFGLNKHILISLIILLFTFVNALGAVVSGRAEDLLVGFKLAVLLIVVAAGFIYINPERLSPAHWSDPASVVAGGMIIFLAYEGFELIANAGADVENPKVLPKAFYSSVLLVIAIYVLVAIVTVGNLSYETIMKTRDYALASAAEPSLGNFGFMLVTLAALASTSSAINATLYGTARASYMVAKYGQLPEAVEKPLWKKAYEGLVVISVLSLILANSANLESISIAGSGGFLLIFLAVNTAAFKLRDKVNVKSWIPVAGSILALGALVILILRMTVTDISNLKIFATLILLSFLIEFLYRTYAKRELAEYIDTKLKRREETIRTWEEWIDEAVRHLIELFKDAEIYLVGSVARGEVHKATDIDLLVVTDQLARREEIDKIKNRHVLDLHFVNKSERDQSLKRAGKYRQLAKVDRN